MDALPGLVKMIWFANATAVLALLSILVIRRSSRVYRMFCSYLGLVLLQNAALAAIYASRGYTSSVYWRAAWTTQAIVFAARALAVAELCRRLLGAFQGIWAIARPLLLSCGLIVAVLYAAIAGLQDWRVAPISIEMGLELAMAAVLVILLALARYYRVCGQVIDRFLAAGLCFYSFFIVVNDMFFERSLRGYESLWVILSMAAFTVTLCTWIYAFLRYIPARSSSDSSYLDQAVYRRFSPTINSRLRLLNEQLAELRHAEVPRS